MWVDIAARCLGWLDAYRGINHLHVGSVVLQFLHPSLLEADAAHFQIERTIGEFHHLLGVWLVCFRVVTIRYHYVDIYLVSGNLIYEILVGRDGNGYSRLGITFSHASLLLVVLQPTIRVHIIIRYKNLFIIKR